jgi:hypothetical protein
VFTPRSVQPQKVQKKEKHMILNGPDKKLITLKHFFFHFPLLRVTVHIGYKNFKLGTKPMAYCWLDKENPKL